LFGLVSESGSSGSKKGASTAFAIKIVCDSARPQLASRLNLELQVTAYSFMEFRMKYWIFAFDRVCRQGGPLHAHYAPTALSRLKRDMKD